MKILITGGSGLLGKELTKINSEIIHPTHSEMNICKQENIESYIKSSSPDIIIHAAALINSKLIEENPIEAIQTNIIGTANIAMVCVKYGIRMVYISTDYIYKGDVGNYKEDDAVFPFNLYAWTKLGGECSTKAVANHLIIRTSFGGNDFPYKYAFVDKWVSKDSIDIIAPLIYEATMSPLTGILNIGTERKTSYDYASKRNANIEAIKIEDTCFIVPYDTSLNLEKWNNYKNTINK